MINKVSKYCSVALLASLPMGTLTLAKGGDSDTTTPPAKTATTLQCDTGFVAVEGEVMMEGDTKFIEVKKLLSKDRYAYSGDAAIGSKTTACVTPEKLSNLSNEDAYDYARELAYNNRFDDALAVLAQAPDQNASDILTYKAFSHRMKGNMGKATQLYLKALKEEPYNIIALSYYGQSLAERGHKAEALEKLAMIEEAGASKSWAYASLKDVINGAEPYRF